jgi:hypothetical protein
VIRVTRAAPSSNANLFYLIPSAGYLNPVFDPAITTYTANVDFSVTSASISALPEDPNATLSGNMGPTPLPLGPTSFNVLVTAEDGTTTKNY